MSKYGEIQTVLREERFLLDALKEMGTRWKFTLRAHHSARITPSKSRRSPTSSSGARSCLAHTVMWVLSGSRTDASP